MKLIALTAALALSAPAFAQTAPAPAEPATPNVQTVDGDPKGGYAPSAPLFKGTPIPGKPVYFKPNPLTPTQAFPPPPPKAEYPVCKKGQYDGCIAPGPK